MTEQATSRHKRFQQALEALSRSPRFALFQGVQIGRLMPEGCQTSQAVSELTFGELVEQMLTSGSSSVVLTSEQEEELYHLLEVLSEESEPLLFGPDDDIPELIPDSFGSIAIPTMDEQLTNRDASDDTDPPDDVPIGSVQLELALRASLAAITAHTRYHEVRKRTVGEFWDPAWTAAPFEEAMSIEQLAGLDLAVLFKKRMVTDTRIQSILRALARVQAHLDGAVPPSSESLDPVATTQPMLPSPPSRTTPATLSDASTRQARPPLSVAACAIAEALEATYPEWPIATALRGRLSSSECASIVLGEEISAATQRDLTLIVKSVLTYHERELIQALLRAPVVRIEHITLALFGAKDATSARARCIATLVARGFGALPLSPCAALSVELWTQNPKLVQSLIRGAQSRATRGSRSVSLPLDLEHLDPYLQEWIQAQGKGKSSRTEKRNRLNNRHRRGR